MSETGNDADLTAANLTKTAYDQMTVVMRGIRESFDVDSLVAGYSESGMEPHAPPPPPMQRSFKDEYSRCVDLVFKDDPMAKTGRGNRMNGADEELFQTDLLHEESCELDHALKSKRKQKVIFKMYQDSIAWHAVDNKGRVNDSATGKASLRTVLHCDGVGPTTLRIVNFDEAKSQYLFCKSPAAVDKLIDELSHLILDFNKTDVAALKAAYADKESQVRDGIGVCRKSVRKLGKKDGATSLWQLIMHFLDEYVDQLFDRLKEARRQSNELRLHVGTNNPHLATRRVAADLDEAINTMALIRAGVKTLPLMQDYLAELTQQQQTAAKILDMMTDETLSSLKDIDDMLENELAEEEDTAVSAMLMAGYGHDDDMEVPDPEGGASGGTNAYISSEEDEDEE